MPSDGSDPLYLSDDSDDLDLQTVSSRLTKQPQQSFTPTSAFASASGQQEVAPTASIPANINNDDDPDWVKDFTLPTEEQTSSKRGRTSYENEQGVDDDDDDRDSIIDLLSDKDDIQPQGSEQKQKKGRNRDKESPSTSRMTTSTPAKRRKTENDKSLATTAASSIKDSLPLTVASKLDDSLTLLQGCTDGDELDLSGDVGAVGRVKVSDDGSVYVDLKGSVFKADGYSCNTMAVVIVGEEDAKIHAVLDEAVLLKCERNLFESDQVLRGDIGDGNDSDVGEGLQESDNFKLDTSGGASSEKVAKVTEKATRGAKGGGARGGGRGRGAARGAGTKSGRGVGSRGGRSKK